MSLRSDFKIRAVTPETSTFDNTTATISNETRSPETTVGRPASALRELIENNRRVLGITPPIPSPHDTPPSPRKVAFLVTHGMGQQVPFETLSMIGQALLTEHSKRHPEPPKQNPGELDDEMNVQVQRVRLTVAGDAPELSRVEITLPCHGDRAGVAHIYESYWAPFTEGQISFTQTVSFLYTAAWNGIRTAMKNAPLQDEGRLASAKRSDGLKHFDRWMFGRFHDMAIKRHTFSLLFLVVLSVSLLLLPALLVFTPLGPSAAKWIINGGTHWNITLPAYSQWPVTLQFGIAILVVLLLAFAWVVRYFVVEYVGDVAIYVSSYKVSRFDAVRDKILKEACSVARQIYSAGISDDSHPAYDSVVIVGHSLGSVVSYDTLNACINWDQIECASARRVVPRTTRFITFGSPLDKTAFLFRTQVSSARNLREALAARQQPLILDYEKFRPASFRWINIHAPADIISGSLEYYDASDPTGLTGINRIHNVIDPEATTPLLAHVQYWENAKLREFLYDAALASVPVAQESSR
jgi:hypothetical protein